MSNPCKGLCEIDKKLVVVRTGILQKVGNGMNSRRYCASCEKWMDTTRLIAPQFRCPCCHFQTRGRGGVGLTVTQKQRRYGMIMKRM